MRRLTLAFLSLVTTLPAALAGGCAADNPTSMIILGNTVPDQGCSFTATDSGPFMFHGVLDVSMASSYLLVPTILSGQTTTAGEPDTAGIISLRGGHVEISGINTEESLALVAAMGELNTVRDPEDCAGGILPGAVGLCSLTVLDSTQVAALSAALGDRIVPIRAEIQVEGMVRGNTISSNTFQWQIDVCRGCLVDSRAVPCADIMDEIGDAACFPGQDRQMICCLTSGTTEGCFNPPQ